MQRALDTARAKIEDWSRSGTKNAAPPTAISGNSRAPVFILFDELERVDSVSQ